jgi:GPH family glycoside/pentoside/hexuronide:cation symporter
VLGVLPHAIIAEIAHLDSKNTGEQKEGLYYAVRNFATKLGQTLGLFIFALLTILGKDPENDLGIRLSGIIGMGLCFLAAFLFSRYRDQSFVLSLREEYQI